MESGGGCSAYTGADVERVGGVRLMLELCAIGGGQVAIIGGTLFILFGLHSMLHPSGMEAQA